MEKIGITVDSTRINCIYEIVNVVNGRRYIGSTTNPEGRFNEHFYGLSRGKHPNVPLQRAYNKYGLNSFIIRIIEVVDDVNSLVDREQFYIDSAQNPYNVAQRAGRPPIQYGKRPPSFGAAISAAQKGVPKLALRGRKQSAEHVANMAAAHRGRKRPKDFCERLSQLKKGRTWTETERSGKKNQNPLPVPNLVGKNIGRLTIIEQVVESAGNYGRRIVICRIRCDCGTEFTKQVGSIKKLKKSCGCLVREAIRKAQKKRAELQRLTRCCVSGKDSEEYNRLKAVIPVV